MFYRDRNDLFVKFTFCLCFQGFHVRVVCKLILIFSRHFKLLCYCFSCQSHSPIVVFVSCFCNSIIRSWFVTSHRNKTHAFGSTCNNTMCHSRLDFGCSHSNSFNSRCAVTVYGYTRNILNF